VETHIMTTKNQLQDTTPSQTGKMFLKTT